MSHEIDTEGAMVDGELFWEAYNRLTRGHLPLNHDQFFEAADEFFKRTMGAFIHGDGGRAEAMASFIGWIHETHPTIKRPEQTAMDVFNAIDSVHPYT